MTQPTVTRLVLYLWVVSILLLVLFALIMQLVGINLMFGGEILWVYVAPGLIGWIHRKKYGRYIADGTAKKVSSFFVASLLLVTGAALFAYLSQNWTARLSENSTFLIVVLAIYFSFLWFIGRWIVSLVLCNFGRETKQET